MVPGSMVPGSMVPGSMVPGSIVSVIGAPPVTDATEKAIVIYRFTEQGLREGTPDASARTPSGIVTERANTH